MQYQQDRADLAPARSLLAPSVTGYGNLGGLNGADAQTAAIGQVEQSPLYQRLIANGTEALLQNNSATGSLRGGDFRGASADFRADTLVNAIQQQLGIFNNGINAGMGGTTAGIAAGDNLTGQIAQNYMQQGQNQASGYLTRAGITAGLYNNIGSGLGNLASQIPGLGFLGKLF